MNPSVLTLAKSNRNVDTEKYDIRINLNIPPQEGRDVMSMFKWSTAGLNSEFFLCKPKLKKSVCPTIYIESEEKELDAYLSQRYYRYVKCKQPGSRFELGSLCPFVAIITFTSQVLQYIYEDH